MLLHQLLLEYGADTGGHWSQFICTPSLLQNPYPVGAEVRSSIVVQYHHRQRLVYYAFNRYGSDSIFQLLFHSFTNPLRVHYWFNHCRSVRLDALSSIYMTTLSSVSAKANALLRPKQGHTLLYNIITDKDLYNTYATGMSVVAFPIIIT